MSEHTVVEVPSADTVGSLPAPARLVESRLVHEVSAWLAAQAAPDEAILWSHGALVVVVEDAIHLLGLVAGLPADQHATLTRHGRLGAWAQVRGYEQRRSGASGWPFELHPHDWILGVPGGVWKLISDDVDDVARDLWDWVADQTAPAEHPVPTARPNAKTGYW